jgi:hypothetical protein
MEENLFPDVPENKLYTESAIRIATFFGGPLVAGFLIANNYKQLGEARHVQVTWLIAIVSTVIIFGMALYLPEKFPHLIVPIAYTGVVYYLVKRLQGAKIKAHLAAGGRKWAAGRVVLVTVAGLVLTFAILFGVFFLMDPSFTEQ